MKVGDLVRFRQQPDPAIGLIVEIRQGGPGYHGIGIMWDFLNGQIGWQARKDIEVISESR